MDILRTRFNDSFISEDLPDGHLERFGRKLDNRFQSRKISQMVFYLGYAAAVALIIVVLSLALNGKDSKFSSITILTNENQEMIEAEHYFQSEIDIRIIAIRKLNGKEKKTILEDIREFDLSLKKLQNDYEKAPGDTRIVNAVLTTYMMKIEALDNIMNILQKHS